MEDFNFADYITEMRPFLKSSDFNIDDLLILQIDNVRTQVINDKEKVIFDGHLLQVNDYDVEKEISFVLNATNLHTLIKNYGFKKASEIVHRKLKIRVGTTSFGNKTVNTFLIVGVE